MIAGCRIGTICFYVTDISRTESFYRDVVGLDVQRMEDDEAGSWLIAAVRGNVELVFFEAECRPGNSPIIVFELADGGIDDVVDGLAQRGASIVTPVSHAPGGWSAEFADADGHVLSVYQNGQLPRRKG